MFHYADTVIADSSISIVSSFSLFARDAPDAVPSTLILLESSAHPSQAVSDTVCGLPIIHTAAMEC